MTPIFRLHSESSRFGVIGAGTSAMDFAAREGHAASQRSSGSDVLNPAPKARTKASPAAQRPTPQALSACFRNSCPRRCAELDPVFLSSHASPGHAKPRSLGGVVIRWLELESSSARLEGISADPSFGSSRRISLDRNVASRPASL
ncbi:uncharacterized protein PAN0_017c5508 [Moesziomyces antarcticus]|uniref:Uncharacterized protein n=1 Tax=Pseudozyma antarctica TaxID=84753 RepID=A0A081CKT5_PSEA2|nr:uncharacterized protein PAN0_017c5508 [Moesziomyces antarcticus]GAK67281.1 hypothetical protein PAN0_017c5508 [Moesziomyces antarcticus]